MKNNKNRKKRKSIEDSFPFITKEPKKNRALLVIVGAFLSVLFVFGAVLITVTAVRNSRYVASHGGFGMDEKTANYFASFYKSLFLEGSGADDTPEFWASCPEGETKTYGEYLEEGYEQFVREVLAASSLYSSVASYGKDEKAEVEKSISFLLDSSEFRGSEEAFNRTVEQYGFDLDSFRKASEILYRYRRAKSALYGYSGELIGAAEANEYFETYTYAEMIFVSDSRLSDSVVSANVAALAEAIEIFRETDGRGSGSVTSEMFDGYKKYNSVTVGVNCGYYLNVNSEFTVKVGDESGAPFMHEVFETAISASVGEFCTVDYDGGICFIYKKPLTAGAYADTEYEKFFTDFMSDAADHAYLEILKASCSEVKIKSSFSEIDITAIPYNYLYRTDF